MPTKTTADFSLDRREQILEAAVQSFAECGFHQTTMHEISARAGISVGLIYRYFKSKEEMIAALAAGHKKAIANLVERASGAPTLREAMKIFFTSDCGERSPRILASFVVELFAESSRNPQIARVVRGIARAKADGVVKLIARSPERKWAKNGLTAAKIAGLIFAVNDGCMMRSCLLASNISLAQQRKQQLAAAETLWQLLFQPHANNH
ncbi:MAG TPA: TetR/AcrR family transcriptional regulator [Chthoniobacterales bacterium]|jgi:AcrR family transcriptional regulator